MISLKEIDSISRLVLFSLLENSRLSFRQIAKKINCSATTVLHKIKQLEKDGIVKGYSAWLDYDKLGFELQAIIDVKILKGKLFEVEKQIARHPCVQTVYDVTGNYDVLIVAKFKKKRDLDIFLKKIQSMDFIVKTHTRLILNTIKEGAIFP